MATPISPAPTASLAAVTRAAVTYGAALTFETVGPYEGTVPPMRIRPDEATLLRVIAGRARLTVGGVERVLATGDEAIVRAAEPHRIAGISGDARLVMGFRAA